MECVAVLYFCSHILDYVCTLLEYGDWTNEEISCLKDGLRKYGRAWGKIYRVVGGRKTATQCKQFYDKFCTDSKLELTVALADHSSMKVRICYSIEQCHFSTSHTHLVAVTNACIQLLWIYFAI